MAFNSDHFDLSKWKLTLPVDAQGTVLGLATEIKKLGGYENANYFYDAADGAMVFRASAGGSHTVGSKYARSELREMNGTAVAAWRAAEGSTMSATLKIDELPVKTDGALGKMVIGQIHGASEELVRLVYDAGHLYAMDDHAGAASKETRLNFTNAQGGEPSVALGEKFSYVIDAHNGVLSVKILADGQVYTASTAINAVWQNDQFYFKAGAYLQVNASTGHGNGQDSFYALDIGHKAGEGLGAWNAAVSAAAAAAAGASHGETHAPPPVPTHAEAGRYVNGTNANDSLSGGSGGDTVAGGNGNDVVRGQAGVDQLWGNNGDDRLIGGAGADILKGGDGKDIFVFENVGDVGDHILDFRAGEKLDVAGIVDHLAAPNLTATQLMTLGYLSYDKVSATQVDVHLDIDGHAGPAHDILLASLDVATSFKATADIFTV